MRIFYAGPLPPTGGGIAQHGAALVQALRSMGHSVIDGSWSTRVVLPSFPATDARRRLIEHRLSGLGRFDLVLFPWSSPIQGPACLALLDAVADVPAVFVAHNVVPHERFPGHAAMTVDVLSRATSVVVHSTTCEQEMETMGLKGHVVRVAHPPALTMTKSLLPDQRPPKLLFFGLLRPYKGLDVLLEAIAHCRDSCSLTVAGQPWEPVDRYLAIAEDLGLGDTVSFETSYVPDEDLDQLFRTHHAVVLPYRTASQSGIIPLALAAGRPVLVSSAGGLGEQVCDGVNGVVVEAGDVASTAAGLDTLTINIDRLAAGAFNSTSGEWSDVGRAVLTSVE